MSRDHLIPSVTVDRNGHTKTVYVAPNKNATSPRLGFAAPSLSRFEEQDDDEWEDHDDEDADPEWENVPDRSSWEANGFPASEASDWHYLGFDSDDAYEWSNESIDATEAKEWSNSGFRSNEAREWMDEGFQDAVTASSWKFEMEGRSFSIADAYEMEDAGAESEDGAQWVRVLSEVQSSMGRKGETLTSLISTLKGVNPSAADSYMEARIPYSQWNTLAQAGIEYDMVTPLMDVKRVIEDKYPGEHGDEWNLFTAAGWVGSANNFDTQKHVLISDAIAEGKSQDDCQIFLKYHKGFPEDISIDQVLIAQKWASEAAGDGTLEATKEVLESYDRFVHVFSELDDVEGLVEKHGAKKLDEAMYQGLDTGPAIRSFLEDISVAEISRGAL